MTLKFVVGSMLPVWSSTSSIYAHFASDYYYYVWEGGYFFFFLKKKEK